MSSAQQTVLVMDSALTDSVTAVTDLYRQQHYRETTVFTERNEFFQSVCYNAPHVADEEFCYTLAFNFSSKEELKAGKTYDLAKDTTVLHSTFGRLSVWSWDYDVKPLFSGTLRIVKADEEEIVIEENIRIVRANGQIVVYKGERTFRRKEED